MDDASGSGGGWSGGTHAGPLFDEDVRLALDAGTRVGRYVIRRRLRTGGMSDVFEAEHVELGQRVALKVLHPRAVVLSHDEPQLTARINHPNIVTIHETGVFRDRLWLALEFIDGPSLGQRLLEGPISVVEALRIARDVANALVRAHDDGLLHCDLKPSNVMITPEGVAKVVDFGLASLVTAVRPRGGTPGYMAPEVLNAEASKATDVWGLCRLLDDLFGRRRGGDPVPMPAPLEDLVAAGLRANPAKRPEIKTLRDVLSTALERLGALGWIRTHMLQGRTAERRRLIEALGRLEEATSQVIYIQGEAGIGKSMLVADFAVEASLRASVLYGQAEPVRKGMPFNVWRPLLTEALQARGLLNLDDLRLLLPESAASHVTLLQSVLDELGRAGTPAPGETRVDALMTVLLEVVRLLVDGPTVLILEDTHWMDSASWRLAHRVAHQLDVLLVLVSRPTEGEGPWRLIDDMPRVQRMALSPLDDEAMVQAIRGRIGRGKTVDTMMLARILSTAAGNPYLAGTLLLEAQETEPLSRPLGNVESAIQARISRLSPGARDVLELAAVFGLRAPRAALDGVAARGAETELAAHTLLRVETDELRWDHALAQSVAYAGIPTEDRQRLHQRVATWLSRYRPEGDAALAHHWHEAGVAHKALHHAERAGRKALAAGAWHEAEAFYERCLTLAHEVVDPPANNLERRLALAEVASGLGDLERRAQHAKAALRVLGIKLPQGPWQRAWGIVRGLVQVLTTRVAGEPDAVSQAVARAFDHLAIVHWFRGRRPALVHAQLSGLVAARRGGASPTLARTSAQFAATCAVIGFDATAQRRHQEAQQMARRLDDADTVAFSNLLMGIRAVGQGAWHAAETALDEAQGIWERQANHTQWRNAQNVRFWLYFYQGRDEQAAACVAPLVEQARVTGHQQHLSWGLRGQALLALRAGASSRAVGLAKAAEEALGAVARRTDQIAIDGALALAWLREGRHVPAMRRAERVVEGLRSSGRATSHAVFMGAAAAAEVLFELEATNWTSELSATAVVDELGRLRRAFPIADARWCLWQGAIRARGGDTRRAQRLWQRGLEAARRLGQAPDVALLEKQCQVTTPAQVGSM